MKNYFSAILILFTSVFTISCATQESPKPNIIFFIADDMYRDMFNCLPEGKGKNLTPNLDRLATEGTIMTNQYVVSPVCTPSRYNCLMGRYASRSTASQFVNQTQKEEGQTVIHWNSFITSQDQTLAHYMKELGYRTGMVGKNHVIAVSDLHQFLDYQADPKDPEIKKHLQANYDKVRQAIQNAGFDYADGIYHNNPNFIGLAELAVQNLDWTVEAGVEFIEQHHDQPFFLYFATTVPHQPAQPERSWQADPHLTAKGYIERAPKVLPPRNTLPERISAAGLAGNNKELTLWLDDALGALIHRLESHDILDNTIIFFFNDHGQIAKGSLYQGGALNPSIVWKRGGFKVGNTSDARITNVDFAPTILEMVGAKDVDATFDGHSFKSVLDGESMPQNKSLFFELGYSRAVIKGKYKYLAVRYPDYANNMTPKRRKEVLNAYNETREFRNMKIVNRDPAKPFSHFSAIPGGQSAEYESYGKKPAYFDPDQLYDLEEDPNEMVNLANDPEYQEVLTGMKKEMQSYLKDLPGTFGELKR
ncbi:MAG: sulfatase-like hydrolase/transferase [Saprospiraceae bacterium]|nr:sulfatase-like hydrolase/transferase [Saprospiraceae bacterium]